MGGLSNSGISESMQKVLILCLGDRLMISRVCLVNALEDLHKAHKGNGKGSVRPRHFCIAGRSTFYLSWLRCA